MHAHQISQQSHAIVYLSGSGNYTYIHFLDAPKQLFSKTLSYFTQLLPQFVRIHKSYLINPSHVICYKMDSQRQASLQVGVYWLPISKRRFSEIKSLFQPKVNADAKFTKGKWYELPTRQSTDR